MTEIVVDIIAIVLTIAVLSRIAGDNPLFRAAQYLFVGVSLGLAFVIAYQQVLAPAVRELGSGSPVAALLYGVPLVLGVLLIPRAAGGQELSWLANIPLAIIFGVGAALAISGAIIGTLLPQLLDSARPLPLQTDPTAAASAVVLAIGTILILTRFYYTVPQQGGSARLVAVAAAAGHWLLMVAFGFFFAGALQTYLSALTERVSFVVTVVQRLFGAAG